ncbi:hypothetical protein KKH82_06010 [Patescibacteria group bacterium]|nr:hypothetical protein [Patescibacteria group bacterium]
MSFSDSYGENWEKKTGDYYTEYELDEHGYSLYTDEKTELSMDEFAEKFGVDVENLKIKKD